MTGAWVRLWVLILVICLPAVASAQGVGRFVSPGPLAKEHAHLEGLTNCSQCHSIGQGIGPDKCMACHDDVREQVRTGRGFHADKGKRCETCHPDHLGRNHSLIRLVESDFDHDQTGFPLRGAHSQAQCVDCHGDSGKYKGLDQQCRSCHDSPHGVEQSRRKVLPNCETCHQTLTWDALPLPVNIFDHTDPKQADYVLEHAHLDVECRSCHDGMKFVPVDHDGCADCHADPHRTNFNAPCESCHSAPVNWRVLNFNHSRTRFPLEGQHERVTCEKCHGSSVTRRLAYQTCESCHADPHKGEFAPRGCDDCHSVHEAGFALPTFDHDTTGWPLEGEHQFVPCASCHGEAPDTKYRGIGQDCKSCHDDAHDGQYEPVACARCHTPVGFQEPHFDHDDTEFPHTGAHVTVPCDDCHSAGQWNGVEHGSCNDCHFKQNPHRSGMAPDTCADCHTTTSFAMMEFAHLEVTGFDLAPSHTELSCQKCHDDLVTFKGPHPSCSSCHQPPTKRHYPGNCGDCHQAAKWFPGGLGDRDHAVTGFPLRGAHANLPCASCHAEGEANGIVQQACFTCHARDDAHMHLLGNACEDCHHESSWYRTRFRHAMTGWPLRGSHKLAECIDCHATRYIGTPTECFRCHEADAPAIPAHDSAFFPFCDTCHRPYTWALPNNLR